MSPEEQFYWANRRDKYQIIPVQAKIKIKIKASWS
jgi:hypothetical protein